MVILIVCFAARTLHLTLGERRRMVDRTEEVISIMPTREIHRNEWVEFFNNFSRNHHGWTVMLEVLRSDIGAQVEIRELPLEGIVADLKVAGKDQISIIIEESPQKHITHTIHNPEHVNFEEAAGRSGGALQIESAGGERAILCFCCEMLPKVAVAAI
jgi:hypothetical protein